MVWPCWCIGCFDTVWFHVCFQLYGSTFLWHGMDLGTCDIVHWSAAFHHRIAYRTGHWVCVVLVLNVIRCSCHYFLDKILFHHIFIMIIVIIIGILRTINYLLVYTLGFRYISSSGSANAQLPGYFRPWTFSLYIGLSMFLLDSCMSCLHSVLGYSTGKFQALQQIVLAAFGAMDY